MRQQKIVSKKPYEITTAIILLLSLATLSAPNPTIHTQEQTTTSTPTVTPFETSSVTVNPIYVEDGQVTGQRILDVSAAPTMETTYSANGTLLEQGINVTDIGTFTTVLTPKGVLHGKGQGLVTSNDGQVAIWTKQGRGTFTEEGNIKFIGAVFYNTQSNGSLAFLDNSVGVFNLIINPAGKVTAHVWQWNP